MNIKKISLLILLLFILMGVSFATEINNDSTSTDTTRIVKDINSNEHNNVMKKEFDENVKKASNNKAYSKSYNVTEFNTLNTALTSDEYDDVTLNINSNIKLGNITKINNNIMSLVIEGNGNTLNGNKKYEFLDIHENCSVTINNLKLIFCNSTEKGSIINKGNLIINNSTINNNQGIEGAAIYNGGNLTITCSKLNNNNVTWSGGAIYNSGNLIITGSTLNNNTANDGGDLYHMHYGGGAIYSEENVTINNCTFKYNKALGSYGDGGAITNNIGVLTINDSTLKNNEAKFNGGAISIYDTAFNMNNSIINNNEAKNGGAIDNDWSSINITRCTINNNKATGSGGALYNIYYINNITITDSIINNNMADKGGAIYSYEIDEYEEEYYIYWGKLLIQNSTMKNNNASTIGGAIYNIGQLKINESVLSNNKAKNNSHDIYNLDKLVVINSKIQNNNNKTILNDAVLLIQNTIKNRVDNKDKIIFITKLGTNERNFNYLYKLIRSGKSEIKLNYDIKLDILNNEDDEFIMGIKINETKINIIGNNHTINSQGSRPFYITQNTILNNLTIINSVEHMGGAICNYANLTLRNCIFKDNYATSSGGAIFTRGNLIIYNSLFEDNVAMWEGGAIANEENLTINKSTLNNNTAFDGGAIGNILGYYTIVNNHFNNNSATRNGGAIKIRVYRENDLYIIENNIFINNTDENNSAIYYDNDDKIIIRNNFFDDDVKKSKLTINKIGNTSYGKYVTIKGKFVSITGLILKNTSLNIKINNKNVKVKTNGNGIYSYKALVTRTGTNNVTVSFAGNQNYNAKSVKTTFKAVKQNVKITINKTNNVKYGNNVTIKGLFTDANNKILKNTVLTLKINNKNVKVKTNGNGIYSYKALVTRTGTNNVTVSFAGNQNYNAKSVKTSFKAVKQNVKITINKISNIKYGNYVVISGKFTDANNKILMNSVLKVKLNKKTVTVKTNKKGVYSYKTKASTRGTNNVLVSFVGNGNYNKNSMKTTFKVN